MVTYANPKKLPLKKLNPADYYRELEQASYALGMLQVAHGKIANSEHLIKPLLTREASVSSKMEGTITNSQDVFLLDATGKPPKQDTVVVANYRQAMRLATQLNKGRNFTNHKVRQLHTVLLRNTPHKGNLGRYREVDAWIGPHENTPIEDASYVAVYHTQVLSYMDNLMSYFNEHDESPLIKVAIFHYQLEAIHPFEDGNGRIGRMLLPALLHYLDSLSAPVLYSSEYFEKNSKVYREKLHEVDVSGNIIPWITFFLGAIKESCAASIGLVDEILNLNAMLQQQYSKSQSPNMSKVIDFMFENPAFTVSEIVSKIGITRHTVSSLLTQLETDKVIEKFPTVRGFRGASVYVFPALITLTNI